MQWHSASEFFAMGGYALYVWGSVGACAAAMAIESWLLKRRHRRLVEALRRREPRTSDPNAARPRAATRRERTA
ncbi:MAG TPA: heme exporter protein CcmD [Caldimonas sp.]|nr:heme exporter protein CcmD [Caldimonas sp.]